MRLCVKKYPPLNFVNASGSSISHGVRRRRATTATRHAAATLGVALLREESLHLAWLRDCRAVLCRDGEAIELSSDHVHHVGGVVCQTAPYCKGPRVLTVMTVGDAPRG